MQILPNEFGPVQGNHNVTIVGGIVQSIAVRALGVSICYLLGRRRQNRRNAVEGQEWP